MNLSFFPVNGNWGKWGGFGSCNKPCGTGTQQRSRSCTNPKPDHGGKSCSGSSINSRYCNTHKCPGRLIEMVIYFFLRILMLRF